MESIPIMRRPIIIEKFFNLLLVDDSWPNLEAMINIISRIRINDILLKIEHKESGESALTFF